MCNKLKKSILYFLVLFMFFCNYSFAKEKMYYCLETEKTGFDPKEKFKKQNYKPLRFKAKIDIPNNYYSSKDRTEPITKCIRMVGSFAHIMQCHTPYGSTFVLNTKNLKFAATDLIGINGNDDLVLSHGVCEEF